MKSSTLEDASSLLPMSCFDAGVKMCDSLVASTSLFMTVDDLIAVVEQPTFTQAEGLNILPPAPSPSHDHIIPVTLVYPPIAIGGSAHSQQQQYLVNYPQPCQLETSYYRSDPYVTASYTFMSTADFSHPPPTTSNAATFRPNPGGGMIVSAAQPVAIQNFVPLPTHPIGPDNFTACGETVAPVPYFAAENGQMANFAAYPYTATQTQPIIAYNHHYPAQPVTYVQNSSAQHYSHVKTITAHSQHKPNGGRPQGANSGAFSCSDTSSSFIKASAASDTASSCSGGAAGAGRGSAADSMVYHRHRTSRNNANGNLQLRRYSDPRPSTSRQQQQNHKQNQGQMQSNREAISDIVMDSGGGVAKASTAKSTGVDSVDSADSGLTADHSSPEHRTSTPTTTHSDSTSRGQPYPYQPSPPQQPSNVPPVRPQTLPFHSDPTAVIIAGARFEATAEKQSTSTHNTAPSTALNPSGSAALAAGAGGGPEESSSSSPAPPPSSGDGGSNGGGTNSTPGVAIGFPPVGPHAVYVHVNLGETLSVRVGNDIQHIPGPATVRMVSSHNAGPPLPLPLHVPAGHVVQQIVDENGTLRHLILSPETPQPPPVTAGGPFPCVSVPSVLGPSVQFVPVNGSVTHAGVRVHGPSTVAGPIHAPNGPAAVPVAVLGAAPNSCAPGPPYHPVHGAPPHTAVLQPSPAPMVAVAPVSVHHHNPNAPPNAAVRHPLHLHTNPPHMCQLHINGGNGEDGHIYAAGERGFAGRTVNRGGGKNTNAGTANQASTGASSQRTYNNEYQEVGNSSPLHDTTMDDDTSAATSGGNEDDEISKIAEMLSRIPPPQVCDIGPREALVQWQPFDCSEASASGGPFPQIDASEFTYEILLYERRSEGKPTNNYRCQADQLQQQWLANLKPSTEYYVRLRALLEERGLHGEPSSAVAFKTKPTHPDKMQPPRVMQRAKSSLVLRWQQPCDNGAKIAGYHVEVDESGSGGDGAFKEVYCGLTKQFKLQKLQPSTLYRLRVAAGNQHGKGEFSDILLVQTTGAAPVQPDPPVLAQATSHSLSLQWKRRDGDEEFQLLMEDPQTGHGYLPVATTRDVSYVVQSLMRFKEYRFRLTASNDDGRSLPSNIVTFKTLPSRPQAPARPHAKGRVAANNVKIAWEQPKDTGGSDITHYFLDMCNETAGAANGNWSNIYEGPAHEHHVTGLEPGVSYRFRVACSSLGGRSAYSDDLSVATSPVPPGPCRPPVLNGKSKSTSLHLKWSSPDFRGGAEISEYEVMIESSSLVNAQPASSTLAPNNADSVAFSVDSASSSHTVYQGPRTDYVLSSGLLPGRTYAFRVRAYNRAGAGQWSERFECQTASAPPESPQRLRLTGQTPSSVALVWDPPSSNNGAPITEYRLHQACRTINRENGGPLDKLAELPDTLHHNAATISPTRSRGTASSTHSTESSSSSAARVATAVRQSPASSNTVDIPAGSAEADFSGLTQISVGSGLNFEAKGLTPATDYVFRIQAINSAGCSRLSEPLYTRTLPGVPDAPPNVKAETLSLSEILILWDSPLDNGSPIAGYYIDVSPPPSISGVAESTSAITVPIELPAGSTQHLVENLLPETIYRFRVQASNAVGIGPYSSPIKAATFSPPPPPPSLELAVASHNSLKLRWNEPPVTADNAITYTVEIENKTGAFSPVATELPSRSCKVPRLCEATLYRFRIRACSATGGAGVWSDIFQFKTLRMPPAAVRAAPRISDVTETSCQIDWQPIKLAGSGLSLSPGEKIHYSLQIQGPPSPSNDDFRTVYKGPSTSYHMSGLMQGRNYRVRVCSIRVTPPDAECGKESETCGAPSPTCSFSTVSPTVVRRKSSDSVSSDAEQNETDPSVGLTSLIRRGPRHLSDRQWAVLILVMFSVVALLFAFMLQRFIPSAHSSPGSVAGTTTNGNAEQTAFSNQAR